MVYSIDTLLSVYNPQYFASDERFDTVLVLFILLNPPPLLPVSMFASQSRQLTVFLMHYCLADGC
jgi:hypothetical protein